MVGAWAPTTRAQRHFVDVCRGLAAPETEDEQAWRKYCRRVAWESDPANRAAMGTLRRVVDTSWGGSRETYRHMKGQDTADLSRRYRGE
jgi:hypothetical protein